MTIFSTSFFNTRYVTQPNVFSTAKWACFFRMLYFRILLGWQHYLKHWGWVHSILSKFSRLVSLTVTTCYHGVGEAPLYLLYRVPPGGVFRAQILKDFKRFYKICGAKCQYVRLLPTVFGKRSAYFLWGNRPAVRAGALVYIDLGGRNCHPHSHSGTPKGGPHQVGKYLKCVA